MTRIEQHQHARHWVFRELDRLMGPAFAASIQNMMRAMPVAEEHHRGLPNSNRRIGHGQRH